MGYCADDVKATYEVFQALIEIFFKRLYKLYKIK